MVILNEEKKQVATLPTLVAIIAPILTSLVIPFYSSYVSNTVNRFQTPFMDIAMENHFLGVVLNLIFFASPAILYALVLAISIVLLLKAPKQNQLTICIVAFVVSFVLLIYATMIIFNPSLQRIGDLTYPYGSDFPLIACFVYGALLVYAGMTRKAN